MILRCDPCRNHKHDACAGTVRAFIEPDGPDTYGCECYCAERRRARQEADYVLRRGIQEYERRYGREALLEVLDGIGVSDDGD